MLGLAAAPLASLPVSAPVEARASLVEYQCATAVKRIRVRIAEGGGGGGIVTSYGGGFTISGDNE